MSADDSNTNKSWIDPIVGLSSYPVSYRAHDDYASSMTIYYEQEKLPESAVMKNNNAIAEKQASYIFFGGNCFITFMVVLFTVFNFSADKALQNYVLLIAMLSGMISLGTILALNYWYLFLSHKGRFKSLTSLIVPHVINITPKKFNLGWQLGGVTIFSLPVNWSSIALIYVERHEEAGEEYKALVVKNYSGEALTFDSRCFKNDNEFNLLVSILSKTAKHATNHPAFSLAIQPVAQLSITRVISWERHFGVGLSGIFKKKKKKESFDQFILPKGTTLHKGRYEIEESLRLNRKGVTYLAKTHDKKIEEGKDFNLVGIRSQSKAIAYSDINSVWIKQLIIPDFKNWQKLCHLIGRFDSEITAAAQYGHHDVIRWIDVFVERDRAFIVFAALEGDTLQSQIKDKGPLDEFATINNAIKIADIVKALQTLRIDVEDISGHLMKEGGFGFLDPESFLVTPEGGMKLIDLPIEEQIRSQANVTLTRSLFYSAPETMEGAIVKQSDIYSLGAIMYFMLTGKRPDALTVLHPKNVIPEISEELDSIIAEMTAQRLDERIKDIQTVKLRLMELLAELEIKAK